MSKKGVNDKEWEKWEEKKAGCARRIRDGKTGQEEEEETGRAR